MPSLTSRAGEGPSPGDGDRGQDGAAAPRADARTGELEETAPSVRIMSLASSGEGVGRLADGRVVFVEEGVPGDLVRLEIRSERKRMVRAGIGGLLEPSPERVEPRCRHFGRCGGCRWQHVSYPAQLAAKREILRAALERIAGFGLGREIEIVPSPAPYGYRARARLLESAGRLGFRRRGSHEVEAIEACPVLLPALEARRLELVRRRLAQSQAAEADSAGRTTDPRDAATSEEGRRGSKRTSGARGARSRPMQKRASEIEWQLLAGTAGSVACGRVGERRGDQAHVTLEVLGEPLQAGLGSFVQGNALLWDALAGEVCARALAPLPSSSRVPRGFVEIHAGIGFLTLPLARRGLAGVALESSRSALRDLSANLARSHLAERVEVLAGRAEHRRDLEGRLAQADVLVVDPPRTGLDASLVERISGSGPPRIVYVSCDPATLARDLRGLVREGGYRLESLCAFDLFPQTPHVETVASVERPHASG